MLLKQTSHKIPAKHVSIKSFVFCDMCRGSDPRFNKNRGYSYITPEIFKMEPNMCQQTTVVCFTDEIFRQSNYRFYMIYTLRFFYRLWDSLRKDLLSFSLRVRHTDTFVSSFLKQCHGLRRIKTSK